MAQKTFKIKPKNGRWPAEFLIAQLRKIKAERATVEEIMNCSLGEIIENPKTLNPQAVLMRETAAGIAGILSELLLKLDVARILVEHDLKNSGGTHQYGRCWKCEQNGSELKFLSAKRLFAQPSASLCCQCQEAVEAEEKIKQEESRGRTFSHYQVGGIRN